MTDSPRRSRILVVVLMVFILAGVGYVGWLLAPPRTLRAEFPAITVTLSQPGSLPQELEQVVAPRLEEAVENVAGVAHVLTVCEGDRCTLTVYFRSGYDPERALKAVTDHLPELPPTCTPPEVSEDGNFGLPPLWAVLYSKDTAPLELSDIARTLLPQLARQASVKAAFLVGLTERTVSVQCDRNRLAAAGVTPLDVQRVLEALGQPAARAGEPPAEQLRQILLHNKGGGVVRLGDVAAVVEETERPTLARLDRQSGVAVEISGSPNTSPATLTSAVQAVLTSGTLPPGVDWHLLDSGSQKPLARVDRKAGRSLLHPQTDALLLEVRFPPGTQLEEVERGVAALESAVLEVAHVEHVLTTTRPKVPETAWLLVKLSPAKGRPRSAREIAHDLRKPLATFPTLSYRVLDPCVLHLAPMLHCPVGLMIQCPDMETLLALSAKVRDELSKAGPLVDVVADTNPGARQIEYMLDRRKIERAGLDIADVERTLAALRGDRSPNTPRLVFPGPAGPEGSMEGIFLYPADGKPVPLSSLATARMVTAPRAIRRYQGKRTILITADLAPGADLPAARSACRDALRDAWRDLRPAGASALLWSEDPFAAPEDITPR